jgi:hypothetical protein
MLSRFNNEQDTLLDSNTDLKIDFIHMDTLKVSATGKTKRGEFMPEGDAKKASEGKIKDSRHETKINPNPTFFWTGSGREPSSRRQWDSALRAPRKPPGVGFETVRACTQPARSRAHGFRSHGPH